MTGFLLRRLLGAIPTLFVIVTATFFLIRLAPGGPFDQEQRLPPEIQANLEAAYGLDQPMLVQYGRYLSGLARGDFGPSFKYRDFDVTELIAEGLPISVSLGLSAVLLAVALGVPFGTFAALRRDQWPDHALRALALIGIAIPGFVIAPLLALVFGIYLQWLPVAGWEPGTLTDAILPVVSLALPLSAFVARLMRASMIEVLSANFIRSARARGLSHWRIVLHHALRPALLPVVSYLGPATAAVLTGSLVVETIFGIPGMGRYLVQGALNRDYTLVMGMVIVFASLTILLNLLVDLLYGWLDPRIRAQGARSP
ncbi:MAG TPA: oligopeptide ABC transporter permease OppB [Steroidobacteraceae bacterium]|nr:oligopeptide ABC transporter permease OppB [Steroidobacteraceae bacterium]